MTDRIKELEKSVKELEKEVKRLKRVVRAHHAIITKLAYMYSVVRYEQQKPFVEELEEWLGI